MAGRPLVENLAEHLFDACTTRTTRQNEVGFGSQSVVGQGL